MLFDSMRGSTNKYLVSIFYIGWIFLGNFIILNLFLAILLDSFLTEEEDDDGSNDEAYRSKKLRKAMKKKA